MVCSGGSSWTGKQGIKTDSAGAEASFELGVGPRLEVRRGKLLVDGDILVDVRGQKA